MSNYNEQFLKQNPLAVLGVLRDLKSQQVPLRISWSGGQFISKVLAVSPDELVMDLAARNMKTRPYSGPARSRLSPKRREPK
ncbi:regulator [Citrobacter portucalensis]|nr:regulator [Citrobacter portucalensis]